MSHIQRILELKEELEQLGINKTDIHEAVTEEAFVRALTSAHTSLGQETFNEKVWVMLEKWNSVAPIKAQVIMTNVNRRINTLLGSLLEFGVPSNVEGFNQISYTNEAGEINVTFNELKTFNPLVKYLVKEFKDGEC